MAWKIKGTNSVNTLSVVDNGSNGPDGTNTKLPCFQLDNLPTSVTAAIQSIGPNTGYVLDSNGVMTGVLTGYATKVSSPWSIEASGWDKIESVLDLHNAISGGCTHIDVAITNDGAAVSTIYVTSVTATLT